MIYPLEHNVSIRAAIKILLYYPAAWPNPETFHSSEQSKSPPGNDLLCKYAKTQTTVSAGSRQHPIHNIAYLLANCVDGTVHVDQTDLRNYSLRLLVSVWAPHSSITLRSGPLRSA
ncbi:hypothetical protein PABG_11853 [Paracoccidioides brasiliensis Pb03]|nr:hypothetical protein PABG_11853 [Paracoccidioides brasiliensis Pb03]